MSAESKGSGTAPEPGELAAIEARNAQAMCGVLLARVLERANLHWHVSKSAHGPWRISKTPALSLAMPVSYFNRLGLPSLVPTVPA